MVGEARERSSEGFLTAFRAPELAFQKIYWKFLPAAQIQVLLHQYFISKFKKSKTYFVSFDFKSVFPRISSAAGKIFLFWCVPNGFSVCWNSYICGSRNSCKQQSFNEMCRQILTYQIFQYDFFPCCVWFGDAVIIHISKKIIFFCGKAEWNDNSFW